jgi:septum formation inhibitor MinC
MDPLVLGQRRAARKKLTSGALLRESGAMPSRFLFARAGAKRGPAQADHEHGDGDANETGSGAGKPASAPPGVPSTGAAKPRQGTALTGVFGTETVAELCVRQGRPAEAIAIFERLLARKPDDPRASRWQQRLHELGAAAASSEASVTAAAPPEAPPVGQMAQPDGGGALGALVDFELDPPTQPDVAADVDLPVAAPAAIASDAPMSTSPSGPAAPRWSPALVVREPVRSGQVVYAEGRDLVVLAPVSSGAELIADGHVHIYAPLRGRAVAGARGAADAFIFCQRLEAELVGIDDAHLTAEDLAASWRGRAVQIQLVDGALRVTLLGGALAAGTATDRS